MRRNWRLFVTITPLLQSMEGTCHGQCVLWCLLCTWCCQCLLHLSYVLLCVCFLVLSVLAAVDICVSMCVCCGAWRAPGAVSTCCTWHVCSLFVCIVMLRAHLVLLVLAALGVCVGYMWCLEHTYVLAICVVGCLARTWCKRGVALVKFQTFLISYGVTGHICIL